MNVLHANSLTSRAWPGWTARTPLEEGLKRTYQWFVTSGASEIAVKP
jgi:nucleoside-diphosphate-sugar epimerase